MDHIMWLFNIVVCVSLSVFYNHVYQKLAYAILHNVCCKHKIIVKATIPIMLPFG